MERSDRTRWGISNMSVFLFSPQIECPLKHVRIRATAAPTDTDTGVARFHCQTQKWETPPKDSTHRPHQTLKTHTSQNGLGWFNSVFSSAFDQFDSLIPNYSSMTWCSGWLPYTSRTCLQILSWVWSVASRRIYLLCMFYVDAGVSSSSHTDNMKIPHSPQDPTAVTGLRFSTI